jgi:Dockerin type I domain
MPRLSVALILALVACIFSCADDAHAQLRIVTYNTTGAPAAGVETVFKAIGEEQRNGFAKPIDVLLLQEQNNPSPGGNAANASPNTAAFVNLLNTTIYSSPGMYAMSNRTGTGDTTQTLIYRTATVQLVGDTAFSTGGPRQATRFQIRPVGYTNSAADLYIYNSHYKASLDASPPGSNATQRNSEATAIRTNSDALGQVHAIYAGDHNFYFSDSQEPAWGTLVAAGNGQANDPINQVGNWHNNGSFAAVHTQSPCTASVGNCGVIGGMDDRFDFQLVTGELLDNAGLSYISGSYHAFGNNGSTFNDDINNGNTVTFPGVTSYTTTQVLNALHQATDHIPVVADYQVPAIMQASAGPIPSSIDLGSTFNLGVSVSNSANVLVAIGADELTYSLSTTGAATGSYTNQVDQALGGANSHNVALNTLSTGMKSATITLTSTSQGVQNGTINIPISFLVVLPGDYNSDGVVDAGDYDVWRKNAGLTGGATYAKGDGNRDGNVTSADYEIWRSHFGETASGFGLGDGLAAVPEPAGALLMLSGCLGLLWRSRLRG